MNASIAADGRVAVSLPRSMRMFIVSLRSRSTLRCKNRAIRLTKACKARANLVRVAETVSEPDKLTWHGARKAQTPWIYLDIQFTSTLHEFVGVDLVGQLDPQKIASV